MELTMKYLVPLFVFFVIATSARAAPKHFPVQVTAEHGEHDIIPHAARPLSTGRTGRQGGLPASPGGLDLVLGPDHRRAVGYQPAEQGDPQSMCWTTAFLGRASFS